MTGWDRLEVWLRWIVVALVVAALWLPAFTATVPFVAPRTWSVAALEWSAARSAWHRSGEADEDPASIAHLLRQVREVRAQFPARAERWQTVYRLAVAIPPAAMLAGLCALAVLLFAALRWHRCVWAASVLGVLAAGYAAGMAWWLTAAARADLGQAMARVQQNLGAAGWNQFAAGVLTRVGFLPQAGLYLMLLAFFAMLVLPLPPPSPR